MSDPLTFADARTLQQQGDIGRFIKHHMSTARETATHRRSLVLRYPELAEQLTRPPIRFSRPEVWNGYIPPATDCTGAMNTTSCRRALLDLVAEAERMRDQAKETDDSLRKAA
ncbi:hypothetical protein [Streptomyces sp. NPDC093223]|uniref:hypothetical protein n=1 Tax=Streptomyces sp. NPDC093223 TaxID=3366033 RepID=UPI00380B7A4E